MKRQWNIVCSLILTFPGYMVLLLCTSYSALAEDVLYSVIIDAGSTASRVLAQSFHREDGKLLLDGEMFYQERPALGSFAGDPKAGAAHLSKLVKEAERFVPDGARSKTPMAMRATAGLRLLPEEQSKALLDEVEKMFDASPFKTTKKSVDIMEGSDEGAYAWVNVNFLLGKIFGEPKQMVAALDLGGGSTQITFPLVDTAEHSKYPANDVRSIQMFGPSINVYTHSYLGLGLMSARQGVLTKGNPEGATELTSICLNSEIKDAGFFYGIMKYKIKGSANPINVEACKDLVLSHIKSVGITKVNDILNFEITAFSFYYDVAIKLNLIDTDTGAVITVDDFTKKIEETCQKIDTDEPFLCFDLLYISTLLADGFGLPSKTEIKLVKHLNGHEVSWSLGAAFHFLQEGL